MNWLDIAIIIIVGLSLFKGFSKGLIHQAAFFVAILLGIAVSGVVADWLGGALSFLLKLSDKMANSVAIALSFLLILGAVYLASKIITKILNATPLGIFNKLLGALVGGLMSLAILGYIFVFVDSVFIPAATLTKKLSSTLESTTRPKGEREAPKEEKDIRKESALYYPVKNFVPTILAPRLLHKENELIEQTSKEKEENR